MKLQAPRHIAQTLALISALLPGISSAGQIKLYWSSIEDNVIRRANLDGSQAEDVVETGGGVTPDMAFDPVARKMYWPAPAAGGIQRANYDGSNLETVITGLEIPTHVAIDSVSRKIYWADLGGDNSIWRSNLDGTDREMLDQEMPRMTAIEVDPKNGYFYWSEFLRGTIHRASIDNPQDTTVIFDRDVFGRAGLPEGLAIDAAHGYLYATDSAFDAVIRMRLDGSEPSLWLTDGVIEPRGIAFDSLHQRVIWANLRGLPNPSVANDISSVGLEGLDPRIDFLPLGNGFSPILENIAIIEIVVPEPSGLMLVSFGIVLGLLLLPRRRRQH